MCFLVIRDYWRCTGNGEERSKNLFYVKNCAYQHAISYTERILFSKTYGLC